MTSVSVYDKADQSTNEEAESTKESETKVTTQATSTNGTESGPLGDTTPTASETKPPVTETKPIPKSSDTVEDQGAVGGAGGAVGGAGATVGGAKDPLNEMMGAVGGADNMLQALTVAKALEDMGVQQMFAVQPLTWCPHLETVQPLPSGMLDTRAPCQDCGNEGENWVCLVCYKIFCSRYVNEHMVIHGATEQHLVTLSFSDLSVWCYGCDNYIDNQVVNAAKRAAHRHKFGTEMSGS